MDFCKGMMSDCFDDVGLPDEIEERSKIGQDKASGGRRKEDIEREKRRDKHTFKGFSMARRWTIMLYACGFSRISWRWNAHQTSFHMAGYDISYFHIAGYDISYREKKETMNIMRIEYHLNTLEHRNVRGEMEMINSLIYSIAWDGKDNAAYGIGRSHTLSELEILKGFRFKTGTETPTLSFGNSLLYGADWNNTQLNPAISYLHEPFERRFSLALDIAEVFKPFLVDRVIFKLVNMNMLCDNDFVSDLNACLLNERGRSLLRNGRG